MHFIIYDSDAQRLIQIERNLHQALKLSGLKGNIMCICEPPFLARENLLGKVPVVEINGKRWSLTTGKILTRQDLIKLLNILIKD